MRHWILAAVAFVPALAACGPKPPPPIVSLADRACDTQPLLLGAPTLAIGADNKMEIAVDDTAPCVQASNGARSAYIAIILPRMSAPYLLTIRSSILGPTVFAPRIELLDGQGHVRRRLSRSAFSFHGNDIYAGIRAHPDEWFLVVYSDAATVGQQESQVRESIRQDTYTVVIGRGVGSGTTYYGVDETIGFTYAHNGKLTVTAEPMPKVN